MPINDDLAKLEASVAFATGGDYTRYGKNFIIDATAMNCPAIEDYFSEYDGITITPINKLTSNRPFGAILLEAKISDDSSDPVDYQSLTDIANVLESITDVQINEGKSNGTDRITLDILEPDEEIKKDAKSFLDRQKGIKYEFDGNEIILELK